MPTKVEVPPLAGARAPPLGVVAKPSATMVSPPLAEAIAPPAEVAAKPASVLGSNRAADVVVASLLLALGGLVLGSSVRMGIGWGSDGPEGGFVPFWLAIILTLCCASIILRAVRRGSDERFATGERLVRVLKVLLPATAMVAVTPFIGLYAASLLYMAVYMRAVGRHSWALSLALPPALILLVFLVFERWFLVPLPKGPIEAWLGY